MARYGYSTVPEVVPVIKPRDVVRNKHYPHLIYRALADNARCFGYVSTSGHLGYGGVNNPDHWEKAPDKDWWKVAIKWYFRNLLWCLTFKMNNDLGLIGRELPAPHNDEHYRNVNYFIYRAELMLGILSDEFLNSELPRPKGRVFFLENDKHNGKS